MLIVLKRLSHMTRIKGRTTGILKTWRQKLRTLETSSKISRFLLDGSQTGFRRTNKDPPFLKFIMEHSWKFYDDALDVFVSR